MPRSDDLVPLIASNKSQGLGFRQGVVVSWNQATAENVVLVGGTLMENLPILNTSEAALLAEGDVVSVLTGGPTWSILGRMTIPGTPEAVSALSALRTQSDTVTGSGTTSSTSATDLSGSFGPEVTVTVSATGRVLVIVGAQIELAIASGGGIKTGEGLMGWVASGANTIAAALGRAVYSSWQYNTGVTNLAVNTISGASRVSLMEGLTPGATTFTAKYWSPAATSVTFRQRNITVMAI